MIATVTLNPAIDKTIRTSRVVPGSVNRMDEATDVAGGKGVNVTKVLLNFGYDVKTLGLLGGFSGKFIAKSIEDMGAVNAFTKVKGQTRTSINLITDDGYVTELLEPGPEISPLELKKFVDSFENEIQDCEIVILSGSIPKGVDSKIYADLINIASNMGKKVLLDSSGDSLKKGMYARPFMIKPNINELQSLLGRKVTGMQEIGEAASQLVEWGIPHVLVSMGSKGILYAKEGEDGTELYYVSAPKLKTVNTVGSGDAAVAAFAMAVLEGLNPSETVKKCVAVSAANTLSMENGVIDRKKAEEIYGTLKLSGLT